MKITDHILQAFLQDYFDMEFYSVAGHANELKGPLFYEAGEQTEQGWIYLIPELSSLPSFEQKQSLFLCASGEIPVDCQWDYAVLVPENPVSIPALFNAVIRCFQIFEEWERQLMDIRERMGSVDEMLQISMPIFRNPLILFRQDMSIMSMSGSEILDEKKDIFRDGQVHMDLLNAILMDRNHQSNRKNRQVYWGPDYLLGFRVQEYNIQEKGTTTHILTASEYRSELNAATGDLLEILGQYIQMSLYNRINQNGHRNENLQEVMKAILTDRTLDYMEASQQLSQLGWTKDHEYLCLTFQLTYLNQSTLPINAICNHMADLYPYSVSFTYKEYLVTYFDLTLQGVSKDELASQLTPFIRDSYLKAGYSRVMKGHMNLRRQYVQSTLALDVGSRKQPYLWIHHFDQIAMTYIIEQVTRRLPGSMLCHTGLLKLRELDEKNGSEYAKTLRVFLDNHQNVVHSANDLFIHRSTLLYRLERIREIMDTDLEDPEELLYLNLSFVLLDREE